MPGVSDSAILPGRRMRCCADDTTLVTAGSSPTFASVLPARVLIKVDLPTLGMPMIITRIDFTAVPRSGNNLRHKSGRFFVRDLSSTDNACAFTPCSFSRCAIHSFVVAGSARSLLFRILMQGRCWRNSATIGFSLLKGIRASITSITRSTSDIVSLIMRRALFMCPGYHWTAIVLLEGVVTKWKFIVFESFL